jgi:cytochrome P450
MLYFRICPSCVDASAATSTTSAMLTIGFYHILANSSIQQRLVAELNDAFPNHDGLAPTSTNVLAKLPYLSAVVEETARIAGIFGMFPRTAPPGGAVVAGRYVPEGSIVSILAWGQNISEKNFYPSPRSFVPERWLPGEWAPGARTNRHAVTSFSHGELNSHARYLR